MARHPQPLFLARATYRKRRLRDGARVLPLFGLVLFLLPLMWAAPSQQVGAHWLYLFLVWLGLIVLAAVISRALRESDSPAGREVQGSESAERAGNGRKEQGLDNGL